MSIEVPVCLDLSRLVARVGRGPWTGLDRVELAWLRRILREDRAFALVRMRTGFALLDRAGVQGLADRLTGAVPWGRPDLRARLTPGMPDFLGRLESDLRRLAVATCPHPLLKRLLKLHIPAGTVYLNVGHANLTLSVFQAWAAQAGTRVVVMIHDTIPLTHPETVGQRDTDAFAQALQLVGDGAHLVIYNSDHTRGEAESRFAARGRLPRGVVAPPGVEVAVPDSTLVPADLPGDAPYFVTLGTIEPRKNHALLLDVWEDFHQHLPEAEIPRLLILGNRGWKNRETFARLDTLPFTGRTVIERASLPDGAVAALIDGAAGLLHPSLAEGFGYPPAEALALGTPAICSDLPVYREILGDLPVYLPPDDRYQWGDAIQEMAAQHKAGQRHGQRIETLPTWDDHFSLVLSKV